MSFSYEQLLEYHISAQRSMFVDETFQAPGASGKLIFSHREEEAMWNLLFVSNLTAAEQYAEQISQLFTMRRREMIWSLPATSRQPGSPWHEMLRAVWMAQQLHLQPPLEMMESSVSRVHTATQIADFNRLYAAVFWGEPLSDEIAVPISSECHTCGTANEWVASHWLLEVGEHAVAIASLMQRGAVCGLYNVGTDPRFTRRGYATQLVTQLTRLAAAQGCRIMFLLTEDATLPAFYQRLGFDVVETSIFYRRQSGSTTE